MKKTILVTALLMTIFSFGQTFEKAIISQNTHTYNPVKNLECRMIRAITPIDGVHFSDDKISVFVQVYGILEDESLFPLPQYSEKISYTKEEVDGMYLQYNNPLEPSESFIGEFNKMLTSILLYETMAQGYFGGDKFEIYEPEGI
jgi:hypothetical protein